MTKQRFYRGTGAALAMILFVCCVIFAGREVDREPVVIESVKATYYETYLRCYNCFADGVSFANTRVKVRIPLGQTIMDPKSICPKCKVSFSVGR